VFCVKDSVRVERAAKWLWEHSSCITRSLGWENAPFETRDYWRCRARELMKEIG